jgi:hypothetical protein
MWDIGPRLAIRVVIMKQTMTAMMVMGALALAGCSGESADVEDDSVDPAASTEDALTGSCASCSIVVQKSIRGISIDMTPKQVRAHLGAPGKIDHEKNDLVGQVTTYHYGLTAVSFAFGNVIMIRTTSPKVKTSGGIGVGSTESAVRGIRGVKCHTYEGFRSCDVGKLGAGEMYTDFAIANGHVTSVSLSIVLD